MIIKLRESLFSRRANSHPIERRQLQASLTWGLRRSRNLKRYYSFFFPKQNRHSEMYIFLMYFNLQTLKCVYFGTCVLLINLVNIQLYF